MKYSIYILMILLSVCACKEHSTQQPEKNTKREALDSLSKYNSQEFQLNFEYPPHYKVWEDNLGGQAPVINVFPKEALEDRPFGIHEDFKNAYIAFLPEGYGVDAPAGTQRSLKKFGNPLPLSFEVDEKSSVVYLLNNGEVWGFYLRFARPPETWSKYGGIFIRYKVLDFEAKCKTSEDKEISVGQCDPLGEDRILYFGEVDTKSKRELEGILRSLWFSRENSNRKKITELIRVEMPVRGKTIESPLQIKGKARGNWFFEATAPIELLDGDFHSLGKSYIEVAEADWMTEDFVAFQGELDFKKPKTKNGYLLFKKNNASEKPELDRIHRMPVKFQD
ncbi:Gmad2 immunoglobulin-like domain-containing protein [Salegentibacter sp. F14]